MFIFNNLLTYLYIYYSPVLEEYGSLIGSDNTFQNDK